MKDSLRLFGYNVWANNKIFEHLKQLPNEVYKKEVESVFPSVAAVLNHMYEVDYVWLQVLRGKKFEEIIASVGPIREEVSATNIDDMKAKFDDMKEQYETFFKGMKDLTVHTTVHHPHFGTLETNYERLIEHIVNHGTYHRGHLSAILNQQGHKGASTDYIFYLYGLQLQ